MVTGKAKRKFLDEELDGDDADFAADKYFVSNGLELLIRDIKTAFAEHELVDTGNRMDEFFDQTKRRGGGPDVSRTPVTLVRKHRRPPQQA